MIRLLVGLALLPTSLIGLSTAAQALLSLTQANGAAPFLGGLGSCAALWLVFRLGLSSESGPLGWAAALWRRFYVLGHELTHAAAAWSVGAQVRGFHVGAQGGHVDLSRSNAFIALAPYCVPLYTLAVILGYRLLCFWRPSSHHPGIFLLLTGATLAFHLLLTFEALWDHRQPDLKAAGGTVFSLALIGLANAALIVLLLKALFPAHVDAGASLFRAAELTARFWQWAYWQGEALASSRKVS